MSKFRKYVEAAVTLKGGQKKLAESMGCTQQQISYLLNEAKGISAEMAIRIEIATNKQIKRHQLRPDLFEAAL